jgi:hypothetical protein
MYSGHNFYFKRNIASFALLPVIDRKGLEAARSIVYTIHTVRQTSHIDFLHVLNPIAINTYTRVFRFLALGFVSPCGRL